MTEHAMANPGADREIQGADVLVRLQKPQKVKRADQGGWPGVACNQGPGAASRSMGTDEESLLVQPVTISLWQRYADGLKLVGRSHHQGIVSRQLIRQRHGTVQQERQCSR
jgi:hypothetical protein